MTCEALVDPRTLIDHPPRRATPTPGWRNQAACRGHNTSLWFPLPRRSKPVDWETPRVVCARCPVIEDCLIEAVVERIPEGMWGGLTPRQRSRIDTRRMSA